MTSILHCSADRRHNPAPPRTNPAPPRIGLVAWPGLTGAHGSGQWRTEEAFLTPIRGRVSTTIYKICESALWREAERTGLFRGAPIDAHDGFIHFSTAAQVRETAAKHFAGADDLMLIAVDADALADTLRWEESRGGDLFPHLYGALPRAAVLWTQPLPLGPDRRHIFPERDFPELVP
jgi:uncharacterized protein (DUF952 family)